MHIVVNAKTRAKQAQVKKITDDVYEVSVCEVPADGKANAAIIKALAKHLGVAPSRLSIRRGQTSKKKFIELQS